jgi:hypothetical protein
MADKMKEKNIIILCGIICTALIICGILFWPTLYRYDKIKYGLRTLPIRVNRITGYTEILRLSGWRGVKVEKVIKALPIEEKDKIKSTGDFDGEGHYKYAVYNGSKWTITRIKLSILAKDNQGKIIWHKIYEKAINIKPFLTESYSIKLYDYDYAPPTLLGGKVIRAPKGPLEELDRIGRPEGFNPEVRIEEVFGYKGE